MRKPDACGRAIHTHFVAIVYLRTEHGPGTVHGDTTGLDPLVGLAARTGAGLGEILVEPHAADAQPPERLTG